MHLRVLRVFDPHISFEEVLEFKAIEEHPQMYWFIALTLFVIDKNRKRCSTDSYKSYMWPELETMRRSKRANDNILTGVTILLELLEE